MITNASLRRVGRAALSAMTDREIEADPARAMLIAQGAARGALLAAIAPRQPDPEEPITEDDLPF